jgi:16S rRNA (guanine(966)-N(2))-methyltransferase RsmD
VREALFNILGPSIAGRGFVDLCAGTGAVGLEALSRGASRVWLVEKARAAFAVMRKNLDRLGIDPRDDEVELVQGDCGAWLERDAETALAGEDLSAVFIDPPYGSPRLTDWLEAIGRAAWLAADTLLVVEHRRDEVVGAAGLAEAWSRRYGDTALTGLRRLDQDRGERSRT